MRLLRKPAERNQSDEKTKGGAPYFENSPESVAANVVKPTCVQSVRTGGMEGQTSIRSSHVSCEVHRRRRYQAFRQSVASLPADRSALWRAKQDHIATPATNPGAKEVRYVTSAVLVETFGSSITSDRSKLRRNLSPQLLRHPHVDSNK